MFADAVVVDQGTILRELGLALDREDLDLDADDGLQLLFDVLRRRVLDSPLGVPTRFEGSGD